MNDPPGSAAGSRFVTVGSASDIPRGRSRRYVVSGLAIAVFHVGGGYFACRDRCPHMGASLSLGKCSGGAVTCSWHGWSFDLRDGQCLNRRDRAVPVYPVRVTEDRIEVELPVPQEEAG